MRKGKADSRSPAHPNDSLGKLFLPQCLLLRINHLFQCCRTPKFQPPWKPLGAVPSFHTPTAPLSPYPKKAHCSLGTWSSLRKSTWKTTNSPAHAAPTLSQVYGIKSQISTHGNQILGLTSLLFLHLVLGIKMLESPQGTNSTGPTPL